MGCALTGSSFDGELGKGDKFSGILNGSIGLSYRIGRQGYKVVRLVPKEQLAALNNAVTLIRQEQIVPGDTIEVAKERMTVGSLLIPSVVFIPDKNDFNEELQMVNVFRIARYMMRYKDAKIAIVGNTGKDRQPFGPVIVLKKYVTYWLTGTVSSLSAWRYALMT